MLYEVAIISRLTVKEKQEGTAVEKLIQAPTATLAETEAMAIVKTIRACDIEIDLDNVEVLVRPFV